VPSLPPGGGDSFGDGGTAISFGSPPGGGDAARSAKKGFVPPTGLPDWFAKLDTDGDGQIALHEWPADRSMEEFAKYDLNGDGFITPQEVLRVLGPPKAVASNENATGGSGQAPPSNDSGAPPNSSNAASPGNPVVSNDGNGRFTITMNPGGRPGGPPDRGPGGDPNRQRFGGRGFNQSPEERLQRTRDFISRYDNNKDGKLSLDELPPGFTFLRDRFGEFDTNKDGALDAQELQAAFDAMRRSWGGGR
jgi:Ca2+-binding EF-hand superfamily protein